MRLILCLLLLVNGSAIVFCQSRTDAGCKAFEQVTKALREKDTVAAIRLLDQLHQALPDSAIHMLIYFHSGKLYQLAKRNEEAKNCFRKGLITRIHSFCFPLFEGGNGWPHEAKADICIELSRMKVLEKELDSAVYYIYLADSTYLPYQECGTGMQNYRSRITPLIAQTHLMVGDTTRAILRLLTFVIHDLHNARMLFTLLSFYHSPEDIKKAFCHAFRNMKKGEDQFINFTVFGYSVQWYVGGNEEKQIHYIRRGKQYAKVINYLKKGKVPGNEDY